MNKQLTNAELLKAEIGNCSPLVKRICAALREKHVEIQRLTGCWQYWRASRGELLDDFKTVRSERDAALADAECYKNAFEAEQEETARLRAEESVRTTVAKLVNDVL